ncbi:MAG TPA: ABC transporter permease [Clostridia bacterium]|nr:ABC transporter permease [Clostridia bacterium]
MKRFSSMMRPRGTSSLQLPVCIGPISVWVTLFVVTPLAIILYFSFLKSGLYGEIIPTLTLENYRAVIEAGYQGILFRSFLFTVTATALCILLGYPVAYWIAIYGGKWKTYLMFLVVLPEWTDYLIRLYALKNIVSSTGMLNGLLTRLGLISSPLDLLYTPFAVMLGLVYTWLPYMILPIYASLSGLDPNLLKAAADLGATPLQRFFTVTLPLSKGGVFAGTILVAIPCLGEWLVPHLFGGDRVMMVGSLVAFKFTKVGNIPEGSSLALMLTATVLLLIYLLIKWGGEEALEKII